MKKVLSIVMLVFSIICIFTACNNKTQNSGNNGNNQNENNNSVVENNNNGENSNNLGESLSEENGEEEKDRQEILELEKNTIFETKPIYPSFNIVEALNSVSSISGLNDGTKLSDVEIEKDFKFGKLSVLEKEIRSKITDDSIEEIVIVKLGDSTQSSLLFKTMTTRLMELKEQYKDNEKISAILNDGNCYVLKQQGGILVSIISKNAKTIETKMQESF